MKSNKIHNIIAVVALALMVCAVFAPNIVHSATPASPTPVAPIDPFANVQRTGAGKGTNNPPTINVSGAPNPSNVPAGQTGTTGNTKTGTPTEYKGLVRCDGVKDPNNPNSRVCDYIALVDTANYIVSWLIYIAISISLGLFIYAGFLYITGVQKHIEKAHSIFKSVVIGLVFMLLAWFIVSTILDWLNVKDEEFTSLIGK